MTRQVPSAAADPPPAPPAEPLPADCCGGGCQHCVYDLYDEAMARYELELQTWQQRQTEPRQ